MTNQIKYNLSSIPGFNELIKTGEIISDYEKYYTKQQYNTKANKKYSIIKYNKEFLRPDLINTYGFLRSVIVSGQKVLSFAPPKSLSVEKFMLQYPTQYPTQYPKQNEHIIVEEFVEGTMINVFFDPDYEENGSWQIATRNTVGADVSFYKHSNMTFNQMFMEACISNKLDVQCLNPLYCYSFVLQHPSNRIVVPFKNPQLFLVAVYEINQTDESITVSEANLLEVKNSGLFDLTEIKFPDRYEFSTYTKLIETFASGNTPYTVMGVVVKNTQTGERTKIRNPIYEEVRHLRGNQSKLLYQYICLRQSGKLSEYLKYYPETKKDMSNFRDRVHMFTNDLFKNYISCYVKKTQPLNLYLPQYKTHMFKLHEHYLNNLRPNGLYINNTEVIKYVNNLHPSLLMYCLNYNMRKRAIDTIKVEY
jgi:hypothetical protein